MEKRLGSAVCGGYLTFHCFATEVVYHAHALDSIFAQSPAWVRHAIRADMNVKSTFEYPAGWFDDYYDLGSDIVQRQIEEHGEY